MEFSLTRSCTQIYRHDVTSASIVPYDRIIVCIVYIQTHLEMMPSYSIYSSTNPIHLLLTLTNPTKPNPLLTREQVQQKSWVFLCTVCHLSWQMSPCSKASHLLILRL